MASNTKFDLFVCVCQIHFVCIKCYSLGFKIKVIFGHKLRYKMKVTFGKMSPKLRQTNWNVARNNVNVVVVDELPSQVTLDTCLKLISGLDGLNAHQCGFM